MLVTRMLSGLPYQSYIPKPLMPPIEQPALDLCRRVDKWLATTCEPTTFASSLVDAITQPANRPTTATESASAQSAASYLLARDQVGSKHLKKINGLIRGQQGSEFRDKPVWIGSPHPSASWHVGSPPNLLSGLIKHLLADPPAHHPASLTAIFLLFRLLQIHPFADANGRTARLWSIHSIHRNIGPAYGYLQILDILWNRSRVDINSLSLTIQSENSFFPVFAYLETALKDHI